MISYSLAKEYLDNSWSIFPVVLSLDENGKVLKKPAVAWREYQERLPTEEELHVWFDDKKYNAIGLVTGKVSHVVVVDVDSIENKDFYSPMTVKTISGGWHLYYRWEEEIRNDAGIADKPLDFRGDGGFVVLPGSSLNNQEYSWHTNSGSMFLEPLPEKLKTLLKIRKNQTVTQQIQQVNDGLPIASEGNRNQTATQVAGVICKNTSKKLLDLYGYKMLQAWNRTNCNPPLSDNELRSTWNSIYNAQLRNHPDEEDLRFKIFKGEKAISEFRIQEKTNGSGISTGFTTLDTYFKFLPEQLYLLSSPTHQGKTTLALNIASRMAIDQEILFCSLEQGIFIAPRIEDILGKQFPEQLSILTSSKMLTVKKLMEIVHSIKNKPKLLIIDHLHFMAKEGKGVTEDIDTMILDLQNLAKELHIPVFVIAHVRKLNADRPPELDDLRDSSSLSQVPSVVMLLYRKKNSEDQAKDSYLSQDGILLIAKNRIQGKTGVIKFTLKETGEFIFY